MLENQKVVYFPYCCTIRLYFLLSVILKKPLETPLGILKIRSSHTYNNHSCLLSKLTDFVPKGYLISSIRYQYFSSVCDHYTTQFKHW